MEQKERRVSVMPPPTESDHSGDRRRTSVMVTEVKRRQSVGGALARRKQSVWRNSISEASAATPQGPVKVAIENTYRLDPTEKERFKACDVSTVIKAVLRRFLQDSKYSAAECALKCKDISQQLSHEIKELGYTRHKIVCHVIIGEKQEQDFQVGSRCLWNPATDSFASAEFSTPHLFAVGMVHGVYFE